METIIQFDSTIADLHAIVESTRAITATDLSDEKQVAIVHDTRLKLRDARIKIEKAGKAYRADALKFQKDVIAREKELLEIILPEEDRLADIEHEAKQIKERAARAAVLPMRKEELLMIGVQISDEFLLDMDNEQFIVFLNERTAAKNEADRQAIEQEKATLAREAEIKKAQEEAVAKERDRMELLRVQEENARVNKIAEEKRQAERAAQKLIDDAKAEAERVLAAAKAKEEARQHEIEVQKQRQIAEEAARQREIELKKQKEIEEEVKRVQDAAYQAWLAEIEYDKDFPHLWKFETMNGEVRAYRFKSAFKPER